MSQLDTELSELRAKARRGIGVAFLMVELRRFGQERDELRAENKRLRAALETLATAKDWHHEDMWRYAQSMLDEQAIREGE